MALPSLEKPRTDGEEHVGEHLRDAPAELKQHRATCEQCYNSQISFHVGLQLILYSRRLLVKQKGRRHVEHPHFDTTGHDAKNQTTADQRGGLVQMILHTCSPSKPATSVVSIKVTLLVLAGKFQKLMTVLSVTRCSIKWDDRSSRGNS